MAQKPIQLVNGELQEVEASDTSAGAADAGKVPALNAAGKIDDTLLPDGVGADAITGTASGAISAGKLINIFDDGGTRSFRVADASNGREAHAFANDPIADAASGSVLKEGTMAGLTGLTIGGPVYLGTNGDVTQTAPTTSGHISQRVGIAVSATEVDFEKARKVTLA